MTKLVTRIAIVLAIIIVCYFVAGKFNLLPKWMNIFKSNKVEMQKTPVLIKEINDIAQLVSAEYYGEVYADLFSAFEELVRQYGDTFEINKEKLFVKYPLLKKYYDKHDDVVLQQKKLENLRLTVDNLKRELEYKKKDFPTLEQEYDNLKEELKSISRRKEKERHNEMDQKVEDADKRVDAAKKKIKALEKDFENAEDDYKQAESKLRSEEKDLATFSKRNNLVYIGRGVVQAGFDLKTLKEENIDTISAKHLVLTIPPPAMLDTIINPWFIKTAKEEILGYEIFIKERRDYSDDEVTLVKAMCIKELAKSAIEKGIMDYAAKSGKATLEQFFQLLGFEKTTINFKPTLEYMKLQNDEKEKTELN